MQLGKNDKAVAFAGQLNLAVSGKNGNTRNFKAGLGGRLQWFETDYTRFIVLNHEYGESADVQDTDKSFLHLRHIEYYSDALAWELFAQLERNEFTRLSLRALAGAGVRWTLLQQPVNHAFDLGLGAFYSAEELDETPGTTDGGRDNVTRGNIYLVYKYKISDNARLTNTAYYQPSIEEASDYRLLDQFGLQVDLNASLTLNISIDVAKDNQPPQNIKATDASYTTSLGYKF
jgi:putative salt-induced outer membrane protein YdiY